MTQQFQDFGKYYNYPVYDVMVPFQDQIYGQKDLWGTDHIEKVQLQQDSKQCNGFGNKKVNSIGPELLLLPGYEENDNIEMFLLEIENSTTKISTSNPAGQGIISSHDLPFQSTNHKYQTDTNKAKFVIKRFYDYFVQMKEFTKNQKDYIEKLSSYNNSTQCGDSDLQELFGQHLNNNLQNNLASVRRAKMQIIMATKRIQTVLENDNLKKLSKKNQSSKQANEEKIRKNIQKHIYHTMKFEMLMNCPSYFTRDL